MSDGMVERSAGETLTTKRGGAAGRFGDAPTWKHHYVVGEFEIKRTSCSSLQSSLKTSQNNFNDRPHLL